MLILLIKIKPTSQNLFPGNKNNYFVTPFCSISPKPQRPILILGTRHLQ